MEGARYRVRRFCLTLFSVLSETVFAHFFPVLNENEKSGVPYGAFVSLEIFFGSKRNGFRSRFPVSNEK